MTIRPALLRLSVLVMVGFAGGCASSSDTASADKPAMQRTMGDHATGSRIRREQKKAGPTQEIGSEDLDQVNQRHTTETINSIKNSRN